MKSFLIKQCGLSNFARHFTNDLEFYYDKTCVTNTAEALMPATQKNLCNNTVYKAKLKALPSPTTFIRWVIMAPY